MSEFEKMSAGKIYDTSAKELNDRRILAHSLCNQYNLTPETDEEKREEILKELIPDHSDGAFFQGPIMVDYGLNIKVGKNFYCNFNLTVLDTCPVIIGDDVLIGPNVSLVTPVHPLLPSERNLRHKPDGTPYDYEYGKPITIGNNCWIASSVTVNGGVHIGNGCVIGAGSVVTRDIPDNVIAVGNPCRVLRKITEEDSIELKKELF